MGRLWALVALMAITTSMAGQLSWSTFSVQGDQCIKRLPPCGICGEHMNATLVARNRYQQPYFEINATITQWPQQPLLSFLEQAAEANGGFKFQATYYPSTKNYTMGYFINAINGLQANNVNKTYWQLHSLTSGQDLQCGVSYYVPINNEVILFNYTGY